MNPAPPHLIRRLRLLVPNRRLSYHEASHIAELQANVLREAIGLQDAELPDAAIRDLPRIVVRRRRGIPVSGLTHWHNGRWLIVLNADEPETRQRFSLAHELKHVIDHTTKERTCWDEGWRSGADKAERLADHFAACLLMPKRHVKAAWGRHPNLQALADSFGVSLPAARVRASYLGLLDPIERCMTPTTTWDHLGSTYYRLQTEPVQAAA